MSLPGDKMTPHSEATNDAKSLELAVRVLGSKSWQYKGGGGRSRMDWEFGIGQCTILHLDWIPKEVLLYNTGNYIQSLGIDHDER